MNRQKLNCTANDVRIAKVSNVRDPLTGATLTSCVNGATFNFLADFEIVTTSSQARENIGLYIATKSQTQSLAGSCVDNIISSQHQCPGAATGIMCGSDNYHETDPAPDNCGDTSSGDLSGTFGAGAEKVTLEIDNFLCQAPAGSNQVQLPNCTSWQIPGGTIQCISPSPSFPYPFNGPGGTPTAIPGSPSKCNCGIIPLGITVQSPQVGVAKSCTTPNQTNNTSCTLSPEGGTVTYTVTITNTSNVGDIALDQVCDTAYGTVYRSTSAPSTLSACQAGSQTGVPINSTTCNSTTLGDIPTTGSCTFTVTQAEALDVKNIVSVSGHGLSAGTFGPNSSNQVEVVSIEAATTGTISKTIAATTAGCVTVTYGVDVKNTSSAGTDETLMLSALNDDSFGDITKWTSTGNSLVLGTTCGVATGSAGLGSLSGSTGAGTLPQTLSVNGGDYNCQFDAQFCSGFGTITLPGGSTCTGIQHSNDVSATLTNDENQTVSLTPGTLTVHQCFPAAQ